MPPAPGARRVAPLQESTIPYDIDNVLGAVADFLEAHPGETVLMRLQNANEDKDDFPEYIEALAGAVREYRTEIR